MKKLFFFTAALFASAAMMAETITITVSFTDATVFGYDNPVENGDATKIETGSTLTYQGINFDISYESGSNGFRFFKSSAAADAGEIDLRAAANSQMVITAPEGCSFTQMVITGTNITNTYLSIEGYDSKTKTWTGNSETITIDVIKSTARFKTIELTYEGGETAVENIQATTIANKQMVNGQLVIIRDGIRYNAIGQQL